MNRSARLRRLLLAAGPVVLASCGSEQDARDGGPAQDSPWFREVAADGSGLAFVHDSGARGDHLFPEIACGGIALFDADDDGLLDVYCVNAGGSFAGEEQAAANRLYRNAGSLRFVDVTEDARVGDRGYGMGAACGDLDADGHVDLYVTNVGPNVLYRNEGAGRFADRSREADADDPGWGTSAACVDVNLDGALDLFVVNYIHWSPERERDCTTDSGEREYCGPNSYAAPARDTLLLGDGQGGFRDVSEAFGLDAAYGNGLGLAVLDVNRDGWPDVYVANDGTPNQLWRNADGTRFTNVALESGSAVNGAGQAEAGMGVQAIDIDQDGFEDLFLSHLRHETNTFYRGQDDWFEDATVSFGLAAPSSRFTGFGLGFADFDHDGLRDLFVANGRVTRWDALTPEDPYAEPNQLFAGVRETRGQRFVEVLDAGLDPPVVRTSRAAAFGDLDQDGDIDLVVLNRDAPLSLLENLVGSPGSTGSAWIGAKVLEADGTDALLARVTCTDEDGADPRHARVQRAYSYLASNDPRVHFGLGSSERAARDRTLTVRWTDGTREAFGPLASNAYHTLRRGGGRVLE